MNPAEAFERALAVQRVADRFAGEDETEKEAVAPEGWEPTVKKMKKHPEIDNPWALAWYMKNKGDTPGGKEATDFPSPEALREYLHDHPNADPKRHHVVKKDDEGKDRRDPGTMKMKVTPPKGLGDEIAQVWKGKPAMNAVDGLRKRIEDGGEINMLHVNKALQALNQALMNAKGDEAKGLRGLKTKLKGLMKVTDT